MVSFPRISPTKTLYASLFSLIRATRPVHLILVDLIVQITFGETYNTGSYSLCSLHHSPVNSSLLFQSYSSAPYSRTLSTTINKEIPGSSQISGQRIFGEAPTVQFRNCYHSIRFPRHLVTAQAYWNQTFCQPFHMSKKFDIQGVLFKMHDKNSHVLWCKNEIITTSTPV